jgi:phosphinothricin acetyltransferase
MEGGPRLRAAYRAEPRIINSPLALLALLAMRTEPSTLIRPGRDDDVAAIAAIYGWNVEHGTGTFELEAPELAEMARRRDDVVGKGLPWLVAEQGGSVLGYAYANHFRPRPAYRYCLEDSIYLAPQATGRGLGRLLLAELVARCEAVGARQMLAVIGDSANLASIAVHRALGFEPAGTLRAAGWKFDRWIDVVLMQRRLGSGDSRAPGDA